jgi:hypothetical protein
LPIFSYSTSGFRNSCCKLLMSWIKFGAPLVKKKGMSSAFLQFPVFQTVFGKNSNIRISCSQVLRKYDWASIGFFLLILNRKFILFLIGCIKAPVWNICEIVCMYNACSGC